MTSHIPDPTPEVLAAILMELRAIHHCIIHSNDASPAVLESMNVMNHTAEVVLDE